MGYDFEYKVRQAPTASGGTAVTAWFQTFRVPGLYDTASRRGGVHTIPFRDGLYQPTVDEYYAPPTIVTDGMLKRTTSTSTGAGGHLHILTNYEGWWQALNSAHSTLWFGINHPYHGKLERRVRPMGRPIVTDAPWRITTNFQSIDPFWREEDNSTNNGSTFTLAGSAPDGQSHILWTGTTGTITHVASSDTFTLTATPAGGGVLINGDARTVTNSSDGSAFPSYTVNSGRWIRFRPGTNQITRTGGVTVSVDYYAKHF